MRMPERTSVAVESQILYARKVHPKMSARKLKRWLEVQGTSGLPAVSEVHAILQGHEAIAVGNGAA